MPFRQQLTIYNAVYLVLTASIGSEITKTIMPATIGYYTPFRGATTPFVPCCVEHIYSLGGEFVRRALEREREHIYPLGGEFVSRGTHSPAAISRWKRHSRKSE